MYQALGRGVRRNANTTFTVKVEIQNDQGKQVKVEEFTVSSMNELKQKCRDALQAVVDAERDVSLTTAIVNQLLAQI